MVKAKWKSLYKACVQSGGYEVQVQSMTDKTARQTAPRIMALRIKRKKDSMSGGLAGTKVE